MADRHPCCVPYCRRTIAAAKLPEGHEWICGKHWPLVSKAAKAALRLNGQRIRKVLRKRPEYAEYWKLPPGSPRRRRAVAMWRRNVQAWNRCKREAIERAAGI